MSKVYIKNLRAMLGRLLTIKVDLTSTNEKAGKIGASLTSPTLEEHRRGYY